MARVQGVGAGDRTEPCCTCFCSIRPWQVPTTDWVASWPRRIRIKAKLQEIWKLYTDSLASGGSLLNLTPVKVAAGRSPPPLEETTARRVRVARADLLRTSDSSRRTSGEPRLRAVSLAG